MNSRIEKIQIYKKNKTTWV